MILMVETSYHSDILFRVSCVEKSLYFLYLCKVGGTTCNRVLVFII